MASGADIIVALNVAVKVGTGEVGRRVSQQAQFLEEFTCPGFPRVYASWSYGYIMERLHPVALPPVAVALRLLEDHVWRHEPRVEMDWPMHWRYMKELLCDPSNGGPWSKDAISAISTMFLRVSNHDLTRCLTHGDPTLENIMYRYDGRSGYVLIDPIPARPVVGDLLAVDLGKVIQSALGYEDIIRGQTPASSIDLSWTSGYKHDDVEAARYMACFHVARALPYIGDDHTCNALRQRVEDVLLGV